MAMQLTWPSPSAGADPIAEPAIGSAPVRWCMVAVLVSATLLARFGINFGSYSLDFSLIALYGLVAALLLSRRASVDPAIALLYVAGIVLAGLSLLVNASLSPIDRSSPTSLLLLIAIYLPLGVTVAAGVVQQREQRWIVEAYANLALICAVAGIAQFYAQFVVNPAWLFDFTPLVPQILRGPHLYNTVIEVGELHKSNGFFLREPSGFSFVVALAIVLELTHARRWARIGVLAFALLLSYSGSGVLVLVIALMFPLSAKSVLRLLALAGVGLALFWTLGDVLNLSFTASRIEEFGSERSSAYIRYIAPMHVVLGSIDTSPWALLIGHGPGTIQRTAQAIQFFDPTWAKLLFEYGVLGFATFVTLIVVALNRSGAPSSLKAALIYSWLVMDGNLLSPGHIGTLFVLAAAWRVPTRGATRAAGA